MNYIITFSYGRHKDKSDGYVRALNAHNLLQVQNFASELYEEGFAIWTDENFEQIPDGHFRKGCIGEVDFKAVNDAVKNLDNYVA